MLPAVILLLSIVLFRIAPWIGGSEFVRDLAGYSPVLAFALCGGAFLPKKWALWYPAAAMLAAHVVINLIAGKDIFHPYLVLTTVSVVIVSAAGIAVSKKASLAVLLGASFLITVLFHLVSNTVSFFLEPRYASTFAGWWQCQTTGLPGYLPTWVFTLRQLGVALGFTAFFYAVCRHSLPRSGTAPAGTPAPAAA